MFLSVSFCLLLQSREVSFILSEGFLRVVVIDSMMEVEDVYPYSTDNHQVDFVGGPQN